MKVTSIVAILALLVLANSWTMEGHDMKGDASKGVYDGIKNELLSVVLPKLANKDVANKFTADLGQTDPAKMTLKEIDNASVAAIFAEFKVVDPKCDKNNNGKVEGDELKCLGVLWKSYVPK